MIPLSAVEGRGDRARECTVCTDGVTGPPAMTREIVVSLRDGRIVGPHGHSNEKLNQCFQCQGELRAPDGHYHSRYADVNTQKAFSAAICCACAGHSKGHGN